MSATAAWASGPQQAESGPAAAIQAADKRQIDPRHALQPTCIF
jgi:hypothetical protein